MSRESTPQEGIPDTLTFGEMLGLVVSGSAVGYTVLSESLGISYTFCEPGQSLFPESSDETYIPMDSETAQLMIDDLNEFAPEELEEVATGFEDDESHLN